MPPDGVTSVMANAGRRRAAVVASAVLALTTRVVVGLALLRRDDAHRMINVARQPDRVLIRVQHNAGWLTIGQRSEMEERCAGSVGLHVRRC